jgi:RecA/RadA recombinase
VPPTPSDTARSSAATQDARSRAVVEELLRDLGSQLRRGGTPVVPPARLPTGVTGIDQLLASGFPRGRLSEIAGPASSGRTSLALALLARTTGAGELAAVVDCADAFDPASAHSAGALLDRVLWVRTASCREALRSTERLLEAHGFALVLLDLAIPNLRVAPATGPRLARAAASTGAALVVVTRDRVMGTAAEVAIELTPAQTHFTGTPTLLEGLDIRAALVRHPRALDQRCTTVRLRSSRAA